MSKKEYQCSVHGDSHTECDFNIPSCIAALVERYNAMGEFIGNYALQVARVDFRHKARELLKQMGSLVIDTTSTNE
jgi:hypothetical protein